MKYGLENPAFSTGFGLDVLARYYYNLGRIRRYKRAWWKLWLGYRAETDEEFRARIANHLRGPRGGGLVPWGHQ